MLLDIITLFNAMIFKLLFNDLVIIELWYLRCVK